MWPADRAWFVTTNIDSTWTGVGGTEALIDALLRDDRTRGRTDPLRRRSPAMRIILASASPARLATLRAAGIQPEVIVSGVDEDRITSTDAANLAAALAQLKCRAVAAQVDADALDHRLRLRAGVRGRDLRQARRPGRGGRPVAPDARQQRRPAHGPLRTPWGRGVSSRPRRRSCTSPTSPTPRSTRTWRPASRLQVAGAFTIDGLGGAFITGIEGDHHNVVGLSLPLLRDLVGDLGIAWTDLWSLPTR